MRRSIRILTLLGLISASTVTLAACGIKGDLKTPPPVFGADKQAKPLPEAPLEGEQTAPAPNT